MKRGARAGAKLASLLLLLPALLCLRYISLMGVNVLYFDEWAMLGYLQAAAYHVLSLSDLFAQHNEHRIFFPRIVMLALGGLTHYNTIDEMYFGWAFVFLSALAVFCVYWRKFARGRDAKTLLGFLPVTILFFSLRQQENILWGFSSIVFFLTILGVVAAFVCLSLSKRIDLWFVLALLSATLATFSSAAGPMVWLVGPIQILLQDKKQVRKAAVWAVAGVAAFALYLNGYFNPSGSPPLTHILSDPLDAAQYAIVLLGSPFAYDIATAAAFGFVVALIGLVVLTLAYRGKILGNNALWLSLVLYAALSCLITVLGRSGFGVGSALTSRYTSVTGLGIIGLYLLSLSVSKQLVFAGKDFGFNALFALALLAQIVSFNVGWQVGQTDMQTKQIAAYILRTYQFQSDENIKAFLFPLDPLVVKEGAKFLEQNALNAFDGRTIDPSTLLPAGTEALSAIDIVNGIVVSQVNAPIVLDQNRQPTLTITGWAADKLNNGAAAAVFVHIDDKTDIPVLYGLDRLDVANYFSNKNFRFSGYMATFSSAILSRGEHTLSLRIVSKDGKRYDANAAYQVLHLSVN